MTDPLYNEAVEFARTRVGFTRDRFQRVMRVGFIKRDTLLQALEDSGVIRRASNRPGYFLAVEDDEEFCPECCAGLESSEHWEHAGGAA